MTRWPLPWATTTKCRETDIVRLAKYRLTKPSYGDLPFFMLSCSAAEPVSPTRISPSYRAYQRGFFVVEIDPIRQFTPAAYLPCNPSSRLAAKPPQHTWYVGVGVHRNATFTAQRSRHWLPHAFGLRARLRAFSFGYRVLPIPNRKGQSPKSSKSAASGYRRRPTRGGTTGSKGHYF